MLLRAVWREPRAGGAPPRGRLDWALVAGFAAFAVLEALLRPGVPWRWVSLGLALGLVPLLLWRRSHPLLPVAVAFPACGVAALLTSGAPPDMFALSFLVLLPFALFRWGSGAEAVTGAAIITAKIVATVLVGDVGGGEVLEGFAVLGAMSATGLALRFRARARHRELEQARLLERERLARDLHDTVAHHVSAMRIRAQAGIVTEEFTPGAAVDALKVIEAEAARALDEMRAIVRLLRGAEPAPAAQDGGIADIEQFADVGPAPSVDVRIDGAVGDVPAAIGSAVYRLAQESVTNARRHARHATRIEVRVVADDRAVRLRVSDDGEARPDGAPGYGLIGMRERAVLLGGVCEAGPAPGRGWTVAAVLPLAGALDGAAA
ncbi:sensor histidine kinase [Dactylosporangium sucinum]|uniref:histidine kinase n=1 Tax=Dactylosporangium sucinum TaxID=1424081 RepID=A0A917WUW5_9ACTN|nr:histidine kinase [Dactylosporangium sucinum]GGM30996.1 two-component sensor histidine kinase [Dactylosporangium sucinum]